MHRVTCTRQFGVEVFLSCLSLTPHRVWVLVRARVWTQYYYLAPSPSSLPPRARSSNATTSATASTQAASAPASITAEDCVRCDDTIRCADATTLDTIELGHGRWRLGPRSTIVETCDVVISSAKNTPSWSPCRGGAAPGVLGDGYCESGYTGPLCRVCVNETEYYADDQKRCFECPRLANQVGIMLGIASGVCLGVLLLYWLLASGWLPHGVQHVLHRWAVKASALSLMPKLKVRIPPVTHPPLSNPGLTHTHRRRPAALVHVWPCARGSCSLRFTSRSLRCHSCTM